MNLWLKWRCFWVLYLHILLVAKIGFFTEAGILPLTLLQRFAPETDVDRGKQDTSTIAATIAHRFAGFIEYQPNGTIILRSSSLGNTTNIQNLMLFKTILKAIKFAAPLEGAPIDSASKFNIKIYGDGVEHKFPPFLENIIQRIQTYFSVYRYTDTSRPVHQQTIASGHGTSPGTNTHNYLSTTVNDHLGYVDDFENTTFIDGEGDPAGSDDYPEFIAIGENDGYITVGKD